MTARVLDGKALAKQLRAQLSVDVAEFVGKRGRAPGLSVVLVGEDPASAVYVASKEKMAREVGMAGEVVRLPHDVDRATLEKTLIALRERPEVDGILVQLPLPKHLPEQAMLDLVPFEKDVDGFHPMNVGALSLGRPALVPCTPLGCLALLDEAGRQLGRTFVGARAVVVGRSNIVGKPVAQLLLQRHLTVTIAHSKTKDLPEVCREADVLIAAVGSPEMIKANYVKPQAIVIDVGINRLPPGPDGKSRLVGDVAFDEVKQIAAAITPVPGGVGPLTIAMLLRNTLTAACR